MFIGIFVSVNVIPFLKHTWKNNDPLHPNDQDASSWLPQQFVPVSRDLPSLLRASSVSRVLLGINTVISQ